MGAPTGRETMSATITREQVELALAGLSREVDDRKGITWFGDRSSVALVVGAYLKVYFGRRDERTLPLRLKLQREWDGAPRGADLIFDLDGHTRRLPTERADWMSDEGGGKTWVMADLPISARHPELLLQLVRAGEVRVRIEAGPAAWSWPVPRQQIDAAARVHAAWRTVTEWERASG
jgi:hypothetical protein